MSGRQQAERDEDLFEVVRAAEIPCETAREAWLIEELWTRAAVGWVAGAPKSLKSWLALELAVSVASGTPCLGRFEVREPGKALIYLAEDSLSAVRERLEALARARGLALEALDVHVITTRSMRLDLGRDQVRLGKTVRALGPRVLVLDPLVRMHRADENSSGEVSSLLGYLRELQREFQMAIVVVHHVRKSAAPSTAQGQGLRGSGDLHAWSDAALYLRRKDRNVVVSVEHRSAAPPDPFAIRLAGETPVRLELVADAALARERQKPVADRVIEILAESGPMTRSNLRERIGVQNQRLGTVLEELQATSRIERTPKGWRLDSTEEADRSTRVSMAMSGNGTIETRGDA